MENDNMNNKVCSKCGAVNSGDFKFCISCGNEISSVNNNEENNENLETNIFNNDTNEVKLENNVFEQTSDEVKSTTNVFGDKVETVSFNDEDNNETKLDNNEVKETSNEGITTTSVFENNNSEVNNTSNIETSVFKEESNKVESTTNFNTNNSFQTESQNVNVINENNKVNVENNNIQNTNVVNNQTVSSSSKLNIIGYITGVLLKPYSKFKEEENNLSDVKNGGILFLIVVGSLTLLGLLSSMINAVRVTSIWSDEVEWVFENLKNVEYVKLIFGNFLTYGILIALVSGVYFIGSLIAKKNASFMKLVSAVSTALIPFIVISLVISPIVSAVIEILGAIIGIAGGLYSLAILFELINDVVEIEDKNVRIYYHVGCLCVLVIGMVLILYGLVSSSISSGLGSLLK